MSAAKKDKKAAKAAPKDAEESDEDSEVEAADIEAIARSHLRPGETILGDEAEDERPEGVDGKAVCNKPVLIQKAKDMEYKVPQGAKRVPWVDTLTIDGKQGVPKGIGTKDGNKLETTFLRLAGEAVREAYSRLRVMKIPCHRPSDFYADMMRSDDMMYKVRARAAEEQRRIRIVEDRKKSLAAKKFAKKAKTKKQQARAAEKTKTLQDIKDWQKSSKRDKQNADDQDLETILSKRGKKDDGEGKGEGKGKGKGKGQDKNKTPAKSKKREAADSRFGFGGKKKRSKQNTADSFDDMSRSPWAKGKGKGKSKGTGKGKGKGKGKGAGSSKIKKGWMKPGGAKRQSK